MKTQQTGLEKRTKVPTRVVLITLGLLLLAGLILLPMLSTSAHFIEQLASFNYFPIVMNESVPLDTPTPTATATATSVPQLTATPTATATSVPQATSTATGTLTPGPSLKVSVTPTEAKINESFTFTIEAGNTGTGPSRNSMVTDSFPTFLDVVTVTTTRGTITKLTHSFVVTIGDINPGEKITITAVVKLNATLTHTEILTNVVAMTYDVSRSITAGVNYKVIFQSLPGTGELPLNWRETSIKPVKAIPWFVLMLIGVVLLAFGIRSRILARNYSIWMITSGALFILVGFAVSISVFGVLRTGQQAYEPGMTPTAGGVFAPLHPLDASPTILPHQPASAFSTPEDVVPLMTLPDYPIPTPDITVTPLPGSLEPDISAVVRIAIPGLSLDTEVKYVPYDGFTWLIAGLRQEVAWMGNTSWPGLGGNTAFAGHVTVAGMGDGPFRHLDELKAGEEVILYTERNIYTYQVRERVVTDDGDMTVLLPTDNPQITLITCVDWDQETRVYLRRLVVFADLISTNPVALAALP